ncbi:hypothetical protein L7F22_025222 [Adiantum nelumboides]|nr:hypothetical protein [Adiantum nelumboides]
MATLFCEQAGIYALARPRYPAQLYKLLASLSKGHKKAWDVGTGNGQAAVGLADYYEEIIATDVSTEQLRYAEARPNITYAATSAGALTPTEVARVVGEPQCLDLITVAQAVHWFDLPSFYSHAQRLLKPGGIIAVWCYTNPEVNPKVDKILLNMFEKSLPFWEPALDLVYDGYQNLHFPFQPALPGQPIRMDATKETNLEGYLGFLESWSGLNTARRMGYELMDTHVKQAFQQAWGSPSQTHTVTFPLYMRVGSPL